MSERLRFVSIAHWVKLSLNNVFVRVKRETTCFEILCVRWDSIDEWIIFTSGKKRSTRNASHYSMLTIERLNCDCGWRGSMKSPPLPALPVNRGNAQPGLRISRKPRPPTHRTPWITPTVVTPTEPIVKLESFPAFSQSLTYFEGKLNSSTVSYHVLVILTFNFPRHYYVCLFCQILIINFLIFDIIMTLFDKLDTVYVLLLVIP